MESIEASECRFVRGVGCLPVIAQTWAGSGRDGTFAQISPVSDRLGCVRSALASASQNMEEAVGIYDIAMLIVLVGAIWFGYWKGLAWQLASIAALIVSYIVAVTFRDQVAQFIQVEAPWNRISAMLVLFLGSSLVIWTIYASVSKSLKKHELKGFDRQAGAVLGAFKGALLCMVITMFSVSFLGENAHEAIDHSKFGPYVEKGIWQVSDFVPAELARFVDPHIASYKEAVGHGEPEVDLGETINSVIGGSTYELDQPLNQDPRQLPPSNQPLFQNQGYTGTWQTSTPASGPGTSAANQNLQFGTNYGAPPSKSQSSSSTRGDQGGFLNSTDTNLISDASKQILEAARQQGIEKGLETARQFLEGNQPSSTQIAEIAQQILEEARKRGSDMGLEAATDAARRWLEGGQQR